MKVDFTGNNLNLNLYNRDNGEGAGERIIEGIVSEKYTIYGEKIV